MGGLTEYLRNRIGQQGPLTVAQYMEACLAHPQFGYYHTRDPFGRAGDFITAPEISQMFGELIGLWCVAVWRQIGRPAPFNLIELGPGRGTLMSDALRAAGQDPAFMEALELNLIETSRALRARQREALADYGPIWHHDLASVPDGPVIAVANEFFDALPVRQFERSPEGWRERLVGCGDDGGLRFELSPEPASSLPLPASLATAPAGSVVEVAAASAGVSAALAGRIGRAGGAALIIDYGHAVSAAGDTLQAVKDHAYHEVLSDPGDADLTTHVDFQCLGEAAAKAGTAVYGPRPQGPFLEALGIRQRAEALSATATADQAAEIHSALDRLVSAEQMGRLFLVMGFAGQDGEAPPGFE
ncbi:MAG: SAM-dependent methyltransferase [Magnetovibrio sp.]|nr:SAM-dependent methyltransferase [Magnetovibrio sp.]